MESAWNILYTSGGIILAVCAFVCLLHALKGPHTADRVIFINMISTVIVMLIGVVSAVTQENFLVDIALIYTMLGFVAVVLLGKVFMAVRAGKEHKK